MVIPTVFISLSHTAYSDPVFTSAEDVEDKSLTSANFGGV
jgi:hypothetical protein